MQGFNSQKNRADDRIPPKIDEKRDGTERRKKPAVGFTYISTVGWICRREQFRRKNDPDIIPIIPREEQSRTHSNYRGDA